MMDKQITTLSSWEFILTKMLDIKLALLRFKTRKERIAQNVNVSGMVNSTSVEVTTDSALFQGKLVNQPATLVQRSNKGYLYINGYISHIHDKDCSFLLNVTKAQWFESKERGSLKWLEEVCMYEKMENPRS